MSKTCRNIFLLLLGYYFMTGDSRPVKQFAIGYAILTVVGTAIVLIIGFSRMNESNKTDPLVAQRYEQEQAAKKQKYLEEVQPVFLSHFKGKSCQGTYYDPAGLDSYKLRFKVLNDSMLSYQIYECEDMGDVYRSGHGKWSPSKKVAYTLAPAQIYNDTVNVPNLKFEFDGYSSEIQVMQSKRRKKKKTVLSTPILLQDKDGNFVVF